MAKTFHICKWIFFAISTFAIIEEIAAGEGSFVTCKLLPGGWYSAICLIWE